MDGMPKAEPSAFIYKGFILLECLIWGVGNAVTKIGLETISPFYCLAVRFIAAFLILYAIFGKKMREELTLRMLPGLCVVGVFTASSFICSTVSLRHASATTVGFLMGISVVFTPFLSWFILRRRPPKSIAFIIALVMAGMYFLCGNSGVFHFGLGEILALSSSLSLAIMLTFSSKFVAQVGPMTLATAQTGFCAVICLVLALLFEDAGSLVHVSFSGWAATAYLALACTCVAYALQNYALQYVSAVFASLAFCTEPIFTAAASYFILGEQLTGKGLFGAILVIAGIVCASIMPSVEAAELAPGLGSELDAALDSESAPEIGPEPASEIGAGRTLCPDPAAPDGAGIAVHSAAPDGAGLAVHSAAPDGAGVAVHSADTDRAGFAAYPDGRGRDKSE